MCRRLSSCKSSSYMNVIAHVQAVQRYSTDSDIAITWVDDDKIRNFLFAM